jgi:glycosyltransferase involved in cell wall biosynthesis
MDEERGISVILPVHGDAPFLLAALESALAQQTNENYEILICLDRPSRKIREFIFSLTQEQIRIVVSKKHGIAHAHNTALLAARYDLIAVMHSDDVMLPDRLEIQSKQLRFDSSLVCLGGQIELIDVHGNFLLESNFPISKKLNASVTKYMSPVAHSAAMYRRNAAVTLGGYRQEYAPAEDYDLWSRMLQVGQISNSEKIVLRYRKHDRQISIVEKSRQSAMKAQISREYSEYFVNRRFTRERAVAFEESVAKNDVNLHRVAEKRLTGSVPTKILLGLFFEKNTRYLFLLHILLYGRIKFQVKIKRSVVLFLEILRKPSLYAISKKSVVFRK